MSSAKAYPEPPAGLKREVDTITDIESSGTCIRLNHKDEELLRAPQTNEVQTSLLLVDGTEIHTVDIDEREMVFAFIILSI